MKGKRHKIYRVLTNEWLDDEFLGSVLIAESFSSLYDAIKAGKIACSEYGKEDFLIREYEEKNCIMSFWNHDTGRLVYDKSSNISILIA